MTGWKDRLNPLELGLFTHFQAEGFHRLGEDADYWLLGLVKLGKHRPIVLGGEALSFVSLSGPHRIFKQAPELALQPDSRFELVEIGTRERPRPAIFFVTCAEPEVFPGCWFHQESAQTAEQLVTFLNEEVKRRLANLPPGDHPQGPEKPPWWTTYDPTDD